MHIADFRVGMLGANGIVGAGMPIATGAALAARLGKSDGVAVAFFGDGASNEGAFHGSLNLASIWKLPVIFVCENNRWAVSVPASYALSVPEVSARAAAYNMPGVTVDGLDVLAVEPPKPDNPLLKMSHVILAPHNASASARFDPARKRRVGQELALVLSGR